jgi:hypothetical protein
MLRELTAPPTWQRLKLLLLPRLMLMQTQTKKTE